MSCPICGATKPANCDCTDREKLLAEDVDEKEEFINDTYKYVQNLHQWAMQQHLASSSKSAPYFKGQEEALWKVLMFLGHPVACGGQGDMEVSDEQG